eukprot:SAG31_NODE_7501_length_1670_cov_1.703374_2_plen_178_part_00
MPARGARRCRGVEEGQKTAASSRPHPLPHRRHAATTEKNHFKEMMLTLPLPSSSAHGPHAPERAFASLRMAWRVSALVGNVTAATRSLRAARACIARHRRRPKSIARSAALTIHAVDSAGHDRGAASTLMSRRAAARVYSGEPGLSTKCARGWIRIRLPPRASTNAFSNAYWYVISR